MDTDAQVLLVLVAATALYGTFTLGYLLTFPWWKKWEGRALIAASGAFALLCGFLLVDHWHNVPNPVWLAIGAVALAGGVFKWVLLLRAWHRAGLLGCIRRLFRRRRR